MLGGQKLSLRTPYVGMAETVVVVCWLLRVSPLNGS